MSVCLSPVELLPTVEIDGYVHGPVEQVFATTELDEPELSVLFNLALRLRDLQDSFGPMPMTKDLGEGWEWLAQWSGQMDTWIKDNGSKLSVPIQPGETLKTVVMVEAPSPDHMDTWQHLPIEILPD